MMNYCNEVQDFINYTISNLRNISGGGIRSPCKRCKNKKKFLNPDVITIHLLQKEFMKQYLCWYARKEPYVPHKTMVERMVESTSSVGNVYGVVDDNNNLYRTMIMDPIGINHGHVGQYPIIDEKPNTNVTRFFDLLKDSNEPL